MLATQVSSRLTVSSAVEVLAHPVSSLREHGSCFLEVFVADAECCLEAAAKTLVANLAVTLVLVRRQLAARLLWQIR